MTTAPGAGRFEFGGFRLDRRRRSLTDPGGSPVNLTPRAFETLIFFVEHPGEVVDRSTLLEAIWPDTIVEENNLSQAVAALRRVLGEGFIVTVPRRGYQFVADVRPLDETGPAEVQEAASVRAQPDDGAAVRSAGNSGRWTPYVVGTIGLLGAAALVFATYDSGAGSLGSPVAPRSPAGGPSPGVTIGSLDARARARPKVAVLPCANLSPDPDDAYFAAGIHEEILNQLTKLSGLRVVARTSVMQYADTRPPIRQIAQALGAAAVLECSVRYAGTDVRVTAQLIDPETDAHVWSNTYPGDVSDLKSVFAIQADIAANIARALDAELSAADARRLGALPTASHRAYVAFLSAIEDGAQAGMADLDRAIAIDPDFGLAYAWRGLGHLARALDAETSGRSPFDFSREVQLAVEDADRALAIDSDLGLAHIVSGARYMGPQPDVARMEASVGRALELSPNDVIVLYLAAGWYLAELRVNEARELLARIVALDPYGGLTEPEYSVGEFLFLAGDLERSSEIQRRSLDREPTSARRRHILAFNAALRGETDEALRQLGIAEELLAKSEGQGLYRQGYMPVYTYGRLGRPDDARRMFDRFVAPVPRGQLLPMMRVLAYLGIGDVGQAYAWAARVVDRPRMPWPGPELWLVLNPMDDPVLEQPDFVALRRKLGYRDPVSGGRRP
jgi:TolB-like protein/DNA-binding winged helix-turn-helix (wHTH) protein